MRVIVCGDRFWKDEAVIRKRLSLLSKHSVVIEGEQRGADLLGRKVAEELGIKVEPYPADWRRYGIGAGPVRNERMIRSGKPQYVIAFHNDLSASKGTRNMCLLALMSGIKTELIGADGESRMLSLSDLEEDALWKLKKTSTGPS